MSPESDDNSVSALERVGSNLLGRRWSVVLTELTLIVLGILIALAIDGWVQDRRDRSSERDYLELLLGDLDAIEEKLKDYAAFESANIDSGVKADKALLPENFDASRDELSTSLSSLASRRTLRLDSAAYTDLISTGNLQLIENRSLREQLIQFFTELELAEAIVEKNNSIFIDDFYFRYMLEHEIDISVTDDKQQATLAQAHEEMLRRLGPDYSRPDDAVMLLPADHPRWPDVRRQVAFRIRIAAVGLAIAQERLEGVAMIRATIQEELGH